MLSLPKLKNVLWFCAVLLLALSFPIQVITGSPYPSLLPYVIIGGILVLRSLSPGRLNGSARTASRFSNISGMVSLYLFLVLLDTGWQASLGVISFYETLTALTIYLLPVVWYWYFRRSASENEIRTILLAIVLAGLIAGIYFAYDSYEKLALGHTTAYANQAFLYTIARKGTDAMSENPARVASGYRSFGLLETHSVSGAWVVLGALAALSLLPPKRKAFRGLTILSFGAILLLGLNFTTIVAFGVIMIVVEFGGIQLLVGKVSFAVAKNLAALALIGFLSVRVALWVARGPMSEFILGNLAGQKDLALGTGDAGLSMSGLVGSYFATYVQHVSDYPLTLLLGDGFTSYGMPKGGDVGFIESIARLGLPFFVALMYGLFRLARSAIRQIGVRRELRPTRMLRFALCVTLLIVVTEVHYTVWTSKSVLPIVFFALALYDRYLVDRSPAPVVNENIAPPALAVR
ncbi:MAG: hypothetical protein M3Z54_13350 [Gemmatimonadota bacterium]|nr:hypothetical protein [Gemmatimonadota bacterium]